MIHRSHSWASISTAALPAMIAIAGLAAPAQAQDDITRRAERALRASDMPEDYRMRPDTSLQLTERLQLDVGGYASFTGLWLDDSSNNERRMFSPEVGLYARASLDNAHTVFARAKFTYRTFSEGDSFDDNGDRWIYPMLDRYWYEFDLRHAVEAYDGSNPGFNINFRGGRQFVDWGSSIVLSEALYAARPTIEFSDNVKLSGLFGYTPDHTVDFDASRKHYDDRTRRGFYGGMLTYKLPEGQEIYGYYLRMEDYNNDDQAKTPPISGVNFKYNSNYLGIGTQGSIASNWQFLGEMVLQLGTSQSDPLRGAQQQEQILAFAGRFQGSYLFNDRNSSRLQAEAIFASGDKDRLVASDTVGGNLAGTSDHAFNSLGFANTGLAFAASFSNLWALRAGASTYPLASINGFENMQIGIDGFLFNKFVSEGGFDESTKNKMFLGGEVDMYVNYRVTSDLALDVRYGIFLPGEAIAGSKAPRQFILFGVTFSF